MFKFVFIATQWGSKHGGINSFNNDLTIAFANLLPKDKFKIVCVVTEMEENDKREAEEYNIDLIKVKNLHNTLEMLEQIKEVGSKILLWIGHDVITGFSAIDCAKYSNSEAAVFHHMDYSEYGYLKGHSADEVTDMDNQQIEVLSKADYVFAIGPKLKESAEDKLVIGEASDKTVIEVIPGLHTNIKRNQLNRFNCISYGRFADNDNIIKQGKLSIAAFCAFSSKENLNNAHLNLFGVEKSQLTELKSLRQKFGQKVENILPYEYKSRKEIFKMLGNQSVSMMLSLREGFGLTGWEAISAGVPVIISKNSGLFMFLENILPERHLEAVYPVNILGDEDGEVNETDLLNVQKQFEKVYKNREYSNEKAEDLKEYLINKGFTWTKLVKKILENVDLINQISAFEFTRHVEMGFFVYYVDLLNGLGYDTEVLDFGKNTGEILVKLDDKRIDISVLEKFPDNFDLDESIEKELIRLEEQRIVNEATEVWLCVGYQNLDANDCKYIQMRASELINVTFKYFNLADVINLQDEKSTKIVQEILCSPES
ncbi:glycosyltransferase [Bacillus toyonensis]|uniref:glycosyltransferase n=1 Tax=Bacillus toyonensis TaxID=155322 RepID=UPI000BEF1F39|nr:glycosyltransferase [Bacillus toyonensis]NKW96662.1 glycosyltransferase family 4 protein [Bacillus toyonensis]PEJ00577.1 hypothetical protein CN671_19510 [Bacillus toyonensis]